MSPKHPNYPYDCPLLLSKDDVKAFRDANVSLASIAAMLTEVKEMTSDSHRTLRGHNGNDGLIARLTRLEENLTDVTAAVDALKEIPARLDSVTATVNTLKEVPAIIETWKRYPSLTYMVRHNFKQMAIITTAAVTAAIAFGIPDPARAEQLRNLIELLFAKWLRL